MSTAHRAVLCSAFFLAGCGASWDTAVIGTSPQYTVAMWRGSDVRGIEARRNEELAPITWTDALGVGLSASWALVDYHEVPNAGADASHIVVEGLHRVDGTERFPLIAPLVESALTRHAVWVASHQEETAAALAPFVGATLATPEPEISAIGWVPGRIEIRITTRFAATILRRPCGGIERPPQATILGGIEWSRTYEIATDGTVTPMSDDVGHLIDAAPACDPRLP